MTTRTFFEPQPEENIIIDYVCNRCGMPAMMAPDGAWVHAEAADAVFCSLVWPR